MKTRFKILSLLVVLSIICTAFPPFKIIAEEKNETVILSELEELRKSNEKHFLCSDGNIVAVRYQEDVHYADSNGKWQDIDNTIEFDSKTQSYKNSKNPSFKAEFFENQQVSLSNLNNTLTWKTSVVSMESNVSDAILIKDQKVSLRKSDEISGRKISEKDVFALNKVNSKMKYQNTNAGVSLNYTVTQNSIKEDVVLEKNIGFANFVTEYQTKQSYNVVVNEDGSINFINSQNELVYQIGRPYLFDALGEYCDDVSVNVSKSAKGYTVTYVPSRSWYESAKRQYPITFDPAVSILNGYAANLYTNGYSFGGDVVNDRGQSLYVGYIYTPGGFPNEQHVYFRTAFKPLNYPTVDLDENEILSITATFKVSSARGNGSFKYYAMTQNDNITQSNVPFVPENDPLGSVNFTASTTAVTMDLPVEDYWDMYYGKTRYGFVAMVDESVMSGSGTTACLTLSGTSDYSNLPTLTVTYRPKNIENRYVFIENSDKYLALNTAGTGIQLANEATRTIDGEAVLDLSNPTAMENPLKSIWLVKRHTNGAQLIVSAYDTTKALAYNTSGTLSLISVSSISNSSNCFWNINYGNLTTISGTVSGNTYLLYNNGTTAKLDTTLSGNSTNTKWNVSDAFAIKGEIQDNREYIIYNPAIEKALQFSNSTGNAVSLGEFNAEVEELTGTISAKAKVRQKQYIQCIKFVASNVENEYYIQPYINGGYGIYYLSVTFSGNLSITTTPTIWNLHKQENGKYMISTDGKYLGVTSNESLIVDVENSYHNQWYIECVNLAVSNCAQETGTTCGASTSAMILRYLGYNVSETDYIECITEHYTSSAPYGKYAFNAYTLNRFINNDCSKPSGVYDYVEGELKANSPIEKYIFINSSSLSLGYPVNLLIRTGSDNLNEVTDEGLYKNKGHYIVTTGVYYDHNINEYQFRINDVNKRYIHYETNISYGFRNVILPSSLLSYGIDYIQYNGYSSINLISCKYSLF